MSPPKVKGCRMVQNAHKVKYCAVFLKSEDENAGRTLLGLISIHVLKVTEKRCRRCSTSLLLKTW